MRPYESVPGRIKSNSRAVVVDFECSVCVCVCVCVCV